MTGTPMIDGGMMVVHPRASIEEHRLTSDRRSLTMSEAQALVGRNTRAWVRHARGDAGLAASRVRYVPHSSTLYIPAWPNVDAWYEEQPPEIECDVSEVDGFISWRYVWLRGRPTPLHPTGGTRERRAWNEGITLLRRVLAGMAPADELALANFGIVQLDVVSWQGAIVPWG